MKIKLPAIALAAMTAFSLTTTYLPEASAQKSLGQCKVTKNNAEFFIEATEKTVKLKKGTLLDALDLPMGQGLIIVKAKIGKKWVRGEIKYEATNC